MHPVTVCLVLLALTCLASLLARAVRLPLPFLQIGVGVVAALPPIGMRVELDPHAFLLLFIPPLLFGDGWRLPRRELRAMRWPVLGHAVGLVLFTVAAGGYALHWLIPAMPLSVAFAVAALVSPTDAVAVSAITERLKVPRRLMHLLESEALLNDASGLVAMRFAVAATLSGGFSLSQAALSFALVACGGLATGWALTLIYARLHRVFLARPGDAALQTVVTGLLPFAAYGVAEALHTSGILAAVAAGVAASRINLMEGAHFTARMQSGNLWNVVTFCLNGVIFVLLGLQLPDIIGSGPVGINLLTSPDRWPLLEDIGALTGLLILLRLMWILASIGLGWLLGQRDRAGGWRVIAAASLAGVRGAIMLAGVLSLPLAMPDGTPFPSRDIAVTLVTGVILCSMLVASAGLPLLLRRGHRYAQADTQVIHLETQTARIAATAEAITAVAQTALEPGPRERALIEFYRARLASLRHPAADDVEDAAWRDLHRVALYAERAAVQRLRAASRIDDEVARALLGELDLLEAALMQRPARLRTEESRAEHECS